MQRSVDLDANPVFVTADALRERTLFRTDLVADRAAFLDTRIPGSERKINYPLIGSGVSENGEQVIPITHPHGFNLGGAVMPAGVVNNLHLHFTAEVFTCIAGEWTFRWGVDGRHEATVSEGDVISIPTWIFRGFTSETDDAWLYTALGRDYSGGLIWAPQVIAEAAKYGSFLSADGRLILVEPGETPQGVALVEPLNAEELASLEDISLDQMRARLAKPADLVWSQRPFLDSELPGGGAELALVIGYGITEHRGQQPRLADPHGFTLAWLRMAAAKGVGMHRHNEAQVLMVKEGRIRVTLNEADPVSVEIGPYDILSVPEGAWRRFESVGDETAQAVVITSGDARVPLQWHPTIVAAAHRAGVAIDADGYRAPAHLVRGQ